MSSILFPSNIQLNASVPLDNRQVVANQLARETLNYAYPGLLVFQEDNQKLYVAKKENNLIYWEEVGSGGTVGGGIKHGYYLHGVFYEDSTYTTPIVPDFSVLYVDDNGNGDHVYIYNKKFDETEYYYICINEFIQATSTTAGIMKLYNSLGNNSDGTCTQQIITSKLNEKIKATIDTSEEVLIFDNE